MFGLSLATCLFLNPCSEGGTRWFNWPGLGYMFIFVAGLGMGQLVGGVEWNGGSSGPPGLHGMRPLWER